MNTSASLSKHAGRQGAFWCLTEENLAAQACTGAAQEDDSTSRGVVGMPIKDIFRGFVEADGAGLLPIQVCTGWLIWTA